MPVYESAYEVVKLLPQEHANDYVVVYRARGKSNVCKVLLSNLIQDDEILNAFAGSEIRNLTACYTQMQEKLGHNLRLR